MEAMMNLAKWEPQYYKLKQMNEGKMSGRGAVRGGSPFNVGTNLKLLPKFTGKHADQV